MDGIDRLRSKAKGLYTEPMTVYVKRMDVIGSGNERTHDNRIAEKTLQNWCRRIAVRLTIEELRRITTSRRKWFCAQIQRAAARAAYARQWIVILNERDQLTEARENVRGY